MSLLDALASYARKTPFPEMGEYWSRDNAAFEKTNPRMTDRLVRAVNPMTMFGSAFGAMHDAASIGSKGDMLLAALQAFPALGALKAASVGAQGFTKAGTHLAPDLAKTALRLVGGATVGSSIDEVQATQLNQRQGKIQ